MRRPTLHNEHLLDGSIQLLQVIQSLDQTGSQHIILYVSVFVVLNGQQPVVLLSLQFRPISCIPGHLLPFPACFLSSSPRTCFSLGSLPSSSAHPSISFTV